LACGATGYGHGLGLPTDEEETKRRSPVTGSLEVHLWYRLTRHARQDRGEVSEGEEDWEEEDDAPDAAVK
jgi:hypothetical protein